MKKIASSILMIMILLLLCGCKNQVPVEMKETTAVETVETVAQDTQALESTVEVTAPEGQTPPAIREDSTEPEAEKESNNTVSATKPSTTKPSATEPSATEPPATEPPATEPPATNPPETDAPSDNVTGNQTPPAIRG